MTKLLLINGQGRPAFIAAGRLGLFHIFLAAEHPLLLHFCQGGQDPKGFPPLPCGCMEILPQAGKLHLGTVQPMEQYQNIPGAAGQLPKLTDHHGVPRLEGGGHLLIGRADPASAAVLFPIEFLRPPLMEGFLPVPVLRLRTHANIANNHIKHLFTTWQ